MLMTWKKLARSYKLRQSSDVLVSDQAGYLTYNSPTMHQLKQF